MTRHAPHRATDAGTITSASSSDVGAPTALGTLAVTPRGILRRQQILEAAKYAFRKADYDDVSVEAISRDSGASVGSVYRYFGSKEGLFMEVLDESLIEMYKAAGQGSHRSSNLRAQLRESTRSYLKAYERNKYVIASAMYVSRNSPAVRRMWQQRREELSSMMLRRLQAHQESSQLPPLDPQTLIRVLNTMVDAYAHRAFYEMDFGNQSRAEVDLAADVLSGVWFRALFGSDA